MTTVMIDGVGSFLIPNEKVQELMEWLNANSVRSEGSKTDFTGSELLNE